jgi:ABC-2 type transport system permease protein
MAAKAANEPSLWPHLLAILWQLLWLAFVLWIGARLFRRGVLQSSGGKISLKALFTRG